MHELRHTHAALLLRDRVPVHIGVSLEEQIRIYSEVGPPAHLNAELEDEDGER